MKALSVLTVAPGAALAVGLLGLQGGLRAEVRNQESVQLLCGLSHQGKAVVIGTHSRAVADACDRVLELVDGTLRRG